MQEQTRVVETAPMHNGQVVPAAPGPATDHTLTTAYDPYAGRRAGSARLGQAIYLIFGILEATLLIRFVLRALGANAEAGFAQAIYGLTDLLVAPFVGLFGTPQAGGAALELHTLVALVVYAAVGWGLARAAQIMFGEGRSATVSRSDSLRTPGR
jgi:YGGT family protein